MISKSEDYNCQDIIINKLKIKILNFQFFRRNWKIKITSFQTLFWKNCPLTGSTVRFVWIRLSCHWTEKYLQNSFRNFRIFGDHSPDKNIPKIEYFIVIVLWKTILLIGNLHTSCFIFGIVYTNKEVLFCCYWLCV